MSMDWMDQLWVIVDTGYAMALGGLIGLERELKDRPAGFRTHMLVASASALLIGIGQLSLADANLAPPGRISTDPLRLVEAVVAGVAFIGAGTIFSHRRGQAVAGITTAASLLMVAVIGVACGFGYHALAFAATLLTLLVLTVLNVLERRAKTHDERPDR
ncbi:MgtC/SapB family protein [Lysobacter sp. Root983]|uniref:MgtC/SapB family protein n=1 Tax=Lysobacter sp. Root983 TaxID=1736613 RepID=UPI000A4EA4A0|nr:MgtC/SapB family protein [Lysobacter sp. Root983]